VNALFKRHRDLQAPGPTGSAQWRAEDDDLAQLIDEARTFRGFPTGQATGAPIHLHAAERVFVVVHDVELIEPPSADGTSVGRYHGVSAHVPGTRSTRYRIGRSKGHYVRTSAKPTAIDTGTAVITDRRVVFTGPKQVREWVWSKTTSVDHDPDSPWTVIAVENRTKVSGIAYRAPVASHVRFRLGLAYAVATGAVDGVVAELEADRADHAQHQPGAPLPPPTAK
jgi:hypothetical protein